MPGGRGGGQQREIKVWILASHTLHKKTKGNNSLFDQLPDPLFSCKGCGLCVSASTWLTTAGLRHQKLRE